MCQRRSLGPKAVIIVEFVIVQYAIEVISSIKIAILIIISNLAIETEATRIIIETLTSADSLAALKIEIVAKIVLSGN
jgi:hypothetical protein